MLKLFDIVRKKVNLSNSFVIHVRNGSVVTDEKEYMKKKILLLCGFSGTNYHGLQFTDNLTIPTIERDVLIALNKAGYISDSNKLNTK